MDKLQIINLTLFIVAAIAFALFFYITYDMSTLIHTQNIIS